VSMVEWPAAGVHSRGVGILDAIPAKPDGLKPIFHPVGADLGLPRLEAA
jgi:hypothetical protein